MATEATAGILRDARSLWYERASIRCTPRRLLTNFHPATYFFPIARQPLAIHPSVTDLGSDAIHFVLIQTAYRYMYDIATLETEVVNAVALKIAINHYDIGITEEMHHEAMSIIVDEAYHALVALDFISQVKCVTHVNPLPLPTDNAVSRAQNTVRNQFDAHLSDFLQLASVCMSENVLTKEIVSLKNEKNVNSFFTQIMEDHLSDEGRHAVYFSKILRLLWQHDDEALHEQLVEFIPMFIEAYIHKGPQIAFEKSILAHLSLTPDMIEEIIEDTYYGYDKNADHNVKSLLNLLRHTEILKDVALVDEFKKRGFQL